MNSLGSVAAAYVQQQDRFRRCVAFVVGVLGNDLEPVREFLHVRDVVDAYARLLVKGQPGETYNVASGRGISLEELLDKLAALVGVRQIGRASCRERV